MRANTEEDFWLKVNKTDDCWLWLASRDRTGYARFVMSGKRTLVHRFAYEALVGPIPEGLELDHLCRVRHCVNPAHLEPVTPKVNVLRSEGLAAINAAKVVCVNGHAFTEENTYILKSGSRVGKRACRICLADRSRTYHQRRKATV